MYNTFQFGAINCELVPISYNLVLMYGEYFKFDNHFNFETKIVLNLQCFGNYLQLILTKLLRIENKSTRMYNTSKTTRIDVTVT